MWAKLHSAIPPSAFALTYAPWPKFDPALLVEETLEIPVQVNGKLRDVINVPADADNATLEAAAKSSEKVKPFHRRQNDQESHRRAEEDGEHRGGLTAPSDLGRWCSVLAGAAGNPKSPASMSAATEVFPPTGTAP